MFSIHDRPALESFRHRLRLDPYLISRLRTRFYKKSEELSDSLVELGSTYVSTGACHIRPTEFEVVSRQDSQVDGATKLALKTHDGHLVETVILRIKSGRVAICVSSQIGCAAGCTFCATGKTGIIRNLTAFEIVDQVAIANRILKPEDLRIRNLVFMGMGEPLHNPNEVDLALDLLTDPALFNLAPGHITVSTVGLEKQMVILAKKRPEIYLALSLHSARQDVRASLIPLAKQHNLKSLHETIHQLNRLQGRPIMVEYLMLAGVNDSQQDLDALITWSQGIQIHVNLIPFNPIPDSPHLTPTAHEDCVIFGKKLRETGLKTTIRYSLGADVTAACGQLAREENRRSSSQKTSALPKK